MLGTVDMTAVDSAKSRSEVGEGGSDPDWKWFLTYKSDRDCHQSNERSDRCGNHDDRTRELPGGPLKTLKYEVCLGWRFPPDESSRFMETRRLWLRRGSSSPKCPDIRKPSSRWTMYRSCVLPSGCAEGFSASAYATGENKPKSNFWTSEL